MYAFLLNEQLLRADPDTQRSNPMKADDLSLTETLNLREVK